MQTVNNSKHTVDANSETPGTANNSQTFVYAYSYPDIYNITNLGEKWRK